MLSITHGAFNKTWFEPFVPGKDSVLEPDSEKLDDRNLYFSTVYIMSFLVATSLLATISRVVYWLLFLLSKMPGKALNFLEKFLSSKTLILPISAAILTFNGTAALIPLIFAGVLKLAAQAKRVEPTKEQIFTR